MEDDKIVFVKTFFITDGQWKRLQDIAKLTDIEIEVYRKITAILHQTVHFTKRAVQTDLIELDQYLVDTAEILQFLRLLKLTKSKESSNIFLPVYRQKKNVLKIAEIKRILTTDNLKYADLEKQIEWLDAWLDFWERMHWNLKSRVDNLRVIHGTTY